LLILLSLMAIAVLVVNIKCTLDLSNETTRKTSLHDPGTVTVQPGESVAGNPFSLAAVYLSRNWAFLMLGMNLACFGTFMYVLVRRFISPLGTMTHAAREIAEGNLSVSVPSQGKDDVGTLARALNDVAANYQEVLLLTGIKVGICRDALERMEKMLEEHNPSPDADELERLCRSAREELGMVSDLVKSFEFYEVHFDGKKVVRNGLEEKG
jgi:HAMP domain-containing protein